ncbi:hypothetical protein [Saccharothrix hoggarensis]|uniref:HNH endonuclease n=1 Tax=Saccharothrix hoggarensis TaxID=913853 RepID=A0ABW3QDR9_9PSEU
MGLSTYNGFSGRQREQVQRWLNEQWDSGELPRPSVCVACGQIEGIIDGHLENYDEPTSYVDLCVTCHLLLHMRFRRAAAWLRYRERVAAGWQAPPMHRRGQAIGELAKGILAGKYPAGVQRAAAPGKTFLDQLSTTAAPLW